MKVASNTFLNAIAYFRILFDIGNTRISWAIEAICLIRVQIYCYNIYMIWFYGQSIIVDYLMPNTFYTYI